jgi:hypothetical protein
MPPTETDYERFILARAGELNVGSAIEFSSATEDFHLVTLLPPNGPLEGDAHQKTGHFHFGSMCYCHKGQRYHHCIGQIAVKSLFRVENPQLSLATRCQYSLVTMRGVKYGNSTKVTHIPRKRVTVHVTDGNALGLPKPDPVLTLVSCSSVTEQAGIIVARGFVVPPNRDVSSAELALMCIAGTTYAQLLLHKMSIDESYDPGTSKLLRILHNEMRNAVDTQLWDYFEGRRGVSVVNGIELNAGDIEQNIGGHRGWLDSEEASDEDSTNSEN